MEGSEEGRAAPSKECVKVAVNIRPLITSELLVGCTDCVTVVPGEQQVQIGGHAFTYDHVYGSSGSPSSSIFSDCVAPLVDALFHGYNATVLAYGQTGSGKTYTMGTNYTGEVNSGGIIPLVMEAIFSKADTLRSNTEILIRVSFIEIFKEEVFDLLDPQLHACLKSEGMALPKPTAPSRAPIQIRETTSGGITLAGVTEVVVGSKEEMAFYLARGSLSRATGSTNMNSQSSRSHAIFTICLEQKKVTGFLANGVINDEIGDDILFAKLHLVDLAGSERAKRTGADGLRLKEGIHINKGLLALGNVISALGDDKKRKDGGHVPYRDSKLTRLLQDSLGGNTKTVMIACISPADTNAEETINTLKYANRARNIQNKAVINRDPVAAEMQRMRSLLDQYQSELLSYRCGGAPTEDLQDLRHRITLLEASNLEIHRELKGSQITCERLAQRALDAEVEKDKLILKIELARSGKPWEEIDNTEKLQGMDLVKSYVIKIQELEAELLRAQSFSYSSRKDFIDSLVLQKDTILPAVRDLASDSDGTTIDISSEIVDEKEREHSTLQDQLDRELQELDKRLEQKEAEMKQFARVDTSVLKQHYERKLLDLEQEKKTLQKEIEDLRFSLANISSAPGDGAKKLKEDYLQKLNLLEAQVSELKKKQEAQSQVLRQKQKSDEAAKRLQEEIQRIKSQKVQLQHKIKQESEQFRAWKATREKEVLQLKKEGRRNEYEMHKLLALNQRQKMVLQRKTEEASLATKRLKDLLEAKKASSRELSGSGSTNGPGIQSLMQAIEHELEVMVRVHEVRSEYERQMKERAAMAKEVAKLKEESEIYRKKIMSNCPQSMSPSARNSRISALEHMLATSSSMLVSMASQLSEAEERERVFSGRGRWNQVRSLADAKNLMNYLFNLASFSRCQLRDKEVISREKDSMISELKEKVVSLSTLVRQLESQITELRNHNLQILASKKNSSEVSGGLETHISGFENGDFYALRKTSQSINRARNNVDLLEDMDTSDSEQFEESDGYTDLSDEDWVASGRKVAKRQTGRMEHSARSSSDDAKCTGTKKVQILSEESNPEVQSTELDACCSCSRYSSCKTQKCECRAVGKSCGSSCGCLPSKCANREVAIFKENEASHPEITGSGESNSFDLDDKKSMELVSQGTMLLQKALNERPPVVNEDIQRRKPLSDIGNKSINPSAPKQVRRKKWRKSVLVLVPKEPLPPSQPKNNEAPRARDDVTLKLPRAMDSRSSDKNLFLTDRNSNKAEESISTSKDVSGTTRARSPARSQKSLGEKENHMM